jgi:hypothetical protein
MCKIHWTEYTRALRKAALARKAAESDATPASPAVKRVRERRVAKPEPIRTKAARGRKTDDAAKEAATA